MANWNHLWQLCSLLYNALIAIVNPPVLKRGPIPYHRIRNAVPFSPCCRTSRCSSCPCGAPWRIIKWPIKGRSYEIVFCIRWYGIYPVFFPVYAHILEGHVSKVVFDKCPFFVPVIVSRYEQSTLLTLFWRNACQWQIIGLQTGVEGTTVNGLKDGYVPTMLNRSFAYRDTKMK